MDLLARISHINISNNFRIVAVWVNDTKVYHCISEGDKINVPEGCRSGVFGKNHIYIYEGTL